MKRMSAVRSDEAGEIMIESMIIVLMTTFILIFLISLGFLLYQRCLVSTVANEVAAEVAQTYRYTGIMDEEINSPEAMHSAVDGIKKYRYLFSWGAMESDNGEKAESYTIERLKKTSFAAVDSGPNVEIKTVNMDIGRRYVQVTVEVKYSIFWGGALKAFGMEDAYVISSTAYAECNDISSYINTVKFTKYACNRVDGATTLGKAVNSMLSLFKTIFE